MVQIISSEDAEPEFRRRSVNGVSLFIAESAAETMIQAADDDAMRDSDRIADSEGVRFDPEGMSELIDGVDGMSEGERIVGWYHSHLGCGCFMSDTDVSTQHSVFGKGMGFAVVIDPLRGEFAVFDNSEVPEKAQMVIVQ